MNNDGFLPGLLIASLLWIFVSMVCDCAPPRFHQTLEAACRDACREEQSYQAEYALHARTCVCANRSVYRLGVRRVKVAAGRSVR